MESYLEFRRFLHAEPYLERALAEELKELGLDAELGASVR
jgi:hypothetical protein